MDRFIGFAKSYCGFKKIGLKSNMDRFIVYMLIACLIRRCSLKSNMDRFIVDKKQADYNVIMFKIQYG